MFIDLAFLFLLFASTQTSANRENRLYLPPSQRQNLSLFQWYTAEDELGCDELAELASNQGIQDFEQCGFYGFWSDALNSTMARDGCFGCGGGIRNSSLTDQLIPVGVPILHGSYSAYTNATDELDGSVLRFVIDMAEHYGLGLEEIDADYDYDECITLLSNNTVDVCIGRFWTTTKRISIVDFSSPLFTEEFFMVTRVDHEHSGFWDVVMNPAGPFSGMLWLAFFITLGILGFGNFLVHLNPHDYQIKVSGNIFQKLGRYFMLIVQVFADSIRKCASGEYYEIEEVASIPQHLIIFGFVIFSFLFITAYGANYTADLVYSIDEPEYNSFAEAIEKNVTVCFPEPLEAEVKFLYPQLVNYKGVAGNRIVEEIFSKDSKCVVGIDSVIRFEEYVLSGISGDSPEETCDKIVMIYEDDPVLMMSIAIPYSRKFKDSTLGREYVETLNFYILSFVYQLYYDIEYYQMFKENDFSILAINDASRRNLQSIFHGATGAQIQSSDHVCNQDNLDNTSGEPLAAYVLMVPIVFAWFCTLAAIVIWAFRIVDQERRVNAHASFVQKLHEENQNGANVSTSDVIDELLYHEWEFNKMNVHDIAEELNRLLVDDTLIEKAIDELPSREALRELYVKNKVSEKGNVYRILSEMPISQLCFIVQGTDKLNFKGEGKDEWTTLLDEKDPSCELIEKIFAKPEYMDRALKIISDNSSEDTQMDIEISN